METDERIRERELGIIEETKIVLSGLEPLVSRPFEFMRILGNVHELDPEYDLKLTCLAYILMDQSLFPCIDDFFKTAVKRKHIAALKLLERKLHVNIHELEFVPGVSAVHHLITLSDREHARLNPKTLAAVEFFLEAAQELHQDATGFTYLHAACAIGDVARVERFLRLGFKVDHHEYLCPPLHTACKHRQAQVARILLEHDADPNGRDRENLSTPLHALARPRTCNCVEFCSINADDAGHDIRPVNLIFNLLVAKRADVNKRNHDDLTPLELAVSILDFELADKLMRRRAHLRQERVKFSLVYSRHVLYSYPIDLYIAEMAQLMKARDYLNDHSKLRLEFLKFWKKHERKLHETLWSAVPFRKDEWAVSRWHGIRYWLSIYRCYGMFIPRETLKIMNEKFDELCGLLGKKRELIEFNENDRTIKPKVADNQVRRLNSIMLTDDHENSLLKLCKSNYQEAYSILSRANDFRLPALYDVPDFQHCIMRHVSHALMRNQFELFAADHFMTKCNLNLPYAACQLIAKNLDYVDLFRLFDPSSENENDEISNKIGKATLMGYPVPVIVAMIASFLHVLAYIFYN